MKEYVIGIDDGWGRGVGVGGDLITARDLGGLFLFRGLISPSIVLVSSSRLAAGALSAFHYFSPRMFEKLRVVTGEDIRKRSF